MSSPPSLSKQYVLVVVLEHNGIALLPIQAAGVANMLIGVDIIGKPPMMFELEAGLKIRHGPQIMWSARSLSPQITERCSRAPPPWSMALMTWSRRSQRCRRDSRCARCHALSSRGARAATSERRPRAEPGSRVYDLRPHVDRRPIIDAVADLRRAARLRNVADSERRRVVQARSRYADGSGVHVGSPKGGSSSAPPSRRAPNHSSSSSAGRIPRSIVRRPVHRWPAR